MPDVTRSDSQRSDSSLRPRVSFNRDVHVKRIVPNDKSRALPPGALSGDGAGHLLPSPVRKARLPKSKDVLVKEAARVLNQVDKIDCISNDKGVYPDKFYTLPARRKHRVNVDSPQSSIDRKPRRRSEELGITAPPPRKPPRTFVHNPKDNKPQKASIFTLFKKSEREPLESPKKPNLKRSKSDATNLKSGVRNDASTDLDPNLKSNKKQLSPIIELTQSEDYFSHNDKENIFRGENTRNVENIDKQKEQSVTEKLKEYIDEVDSAIFYDTGIKVNRPVNDKRLPEVVIIDVDNAEKISKKKDRTKRYGSALAKKLKSLTNKKKDKKVAKNLNKNKEIIKKDVLSNESYLNSINQDRDEYVKIFNNSPPATGPRIQEAINSLQQQPDNSPKMIHSSQKPPQKLPLTRGLAVDSMVKRLSHDTGFPPPPKGGVLITPNIAIQHNNNQPFSYTRGQSPDRSSKSPVSPSSPVIYAHVVCDKSGFNNTGLTKQTVHTTYTNGKKHMPHSDSDEGLGNEENSSFGKSKYDGEKSFTHFGDEQYKNEQNSRSNAYKSTNHFSDEYPITPKFKTNGYTNKFTKTEHNIFIDSSSRGRGDGMDSKRRESLTEPHENEFTSLRYNTNGNRTDLSARRDLLESRINRRMGDKNYRQSPPSNGISHHNNKYVSETKYYRNGSASPVGFQETYLTETKTAKNGDRYITESHTKKRLEDQVDYNNRYKVNGYRHNYESEPKSLTSQVSDYRSSPENITKRVDTSQEYKYIHRYGGKQKLDKNQQHHKSNPEILHRYHDNNFKYDDHETYHDSLKRDKYQARNSAKQQTERYFERNDSERRDKLGDSGIENDFNRDRTPRSSTQRREVQYNESEDEGFASSLLIASERQHTEDNINSRKVKNGYDSDRGYIRDESYRSGREYNSKRHEYTPRERSIDDGSHYDPRIDKDLSSERSTLKKKVDTKPPKPVKKSSLEKVKQLFTRDSSKKNKDKKMVPESNLRARYTEYKGSREHLEPTIMKKSANNVNSSYDYSNRRRLSTPSPSPTREVQQNRKPATHSSWFKSLDRLSRKKSKKNEKETMSEEEISHKPTPTKSLRFFGDTDIESNDSIRNKPKTRSALSNHHNHSSRDLHNISEERHSQDFGTPYRSSNHKSLLNISESDRDVKGSRISLKPPASPNHRMTRDVSRGRDEKNRRKRNEVSSVESSTEGDSSQHSQRNVVYLHAATVGDIPGPGYLRNGRRAASREELTSISSGPRPQVKTLSRSFSVLAPWRPRHYKENMDIDYTQQPKPIKNGKYEQKVTKSSSNRKDNSSTLKKKANETKRLNQTSTLNRKSRSKENLSSHSLKKSKEDLTKVSTSTLYKKKERQPKENMRYSRERDDKRFASKSMSVESLGNGSNRNYRTSDKRDVSRSVSMPRDPEKSAGWFKINKKSSKSSSTQRL